MSVLSIPLTRGKAALVDQADFPLVKGYTWHAKRASETLWYARTTIYRGGRKATVMMHQLLVPAPEGLMIDHKNNDGLDNRRENLRHVTRIGNQRNRRVKPPTPHILRTRTEGVFGASVYLGRFDSAEEARTVAAKAAEIFKQHGLGAK